MAEVDIYWRAVNALKDEKLIIMPTETVYGIVGLATSKKAVEKIYAIKGRAKEKALPIMVSDINYLEGYAQLSDSFIKLAKAFWPGPLTIVTKKGPKLSGEVTGGQETVAVRIPDHRIALKILKSIKKPLAATSANLSGEPPATKVSDIEEEIKKQVALVIDEGESEIKQASTVIDITSSKPKVLREGPISVDDIMVLLQI
ncbi:MAG: threonylcarbamoyl-AMP synthase [Actinobacteria bacterium]|nr:MAG: threonylcarbamoyl-AMP synthase [Actinomycetota bacterium]